MKPIILLVRSSRSGVRRFLCVLFLAVSLFGQGCLYGADDPCADERFACTQDTSGFQLGATCEQSAALDVSIGQGQSEYEMMADGSPPTLYSAEGSSPYVYMALQVRNPELDRYDRLRVRFGLFHVIDGVCRYESGQPRDGKCVYEVGHREVVLGENDPLETLQDGSVQEHGIVMFVGTAQTETFERYLTVDVTDPCGRSGAAEHLVSAM